MAPRSRLPRLVIPIACSFLIVSLFLAGCATPLTPEQQAQKQRVLARLEDRDELNRAAAEARAAVLPGQTRIDPQHHRQLPVPRVRIDPNYPFELRRQRVQGLVWIAFIVTPNGDTAEVKAVGNSDPPFVDAAISAISKWKFRPATDNGKPVNCRLVVPIAFTLNE